jgi:cold-inducible RNA-binding protein
MGRKLYVGNIPYTAGEQDLQELFGACGQVETVSVMRDMATGRARGFAFVEMATDADAQKAIEQLHDKPFGGRNLTVNEARPRTERPGGGFGGGGGERRGGRRESRW